MRMHARRSGTRRQVAVFLGGLALVVASASVVMPGASAGTTVHWPAGAVYTTDLVAGQHTDVGDVSIKYVGSTISVQVVTTGQWCMTELKLAAGPLSAYTNAGGNPIPGKFPVKKSYQPCVSDSGWVTLAMPTGWNYTVAVHATVTDLATGVTKTIKSEAGDTMYGPAATRAALPGTSVPAVKVPANPAWSDVPGADWISTELPADIPVDPVTGYVPDSYRKVVKSFTVSGYVFDVTPLKANSDNAEQVFLNGVSLGSDGQMAEGPVTDDQKYQTVVDYPMTLRQGANTLSIVFRNYGVPNLDPPYTASQNPTALAYKASYKVASTDTAWAAGTPWGGANWAMFVALPDVTSVEVSVDSASMTGTDVTLAAGTYYVVASGTWTNRTVETVDASCSKYDGQPWAESPDGGYPNDLLELQINSTNINWGPCNSTHVYTTTTVWGGGTLDLNLRIYDGQGNVQDPGWFGDNSGSLTVVLYKIS